MFYPNCDLEILTNQFFSFDTSTPELARLRFGFLMKQIVDRFIEKSTSPTAGRSLWLYSAHDITIANILNILGIYVS